MTDVSNIGTHFENDQGNGVVVGDGFFLPDGTPVGAGGNFIRGDLTSALNPSETLPNTVYVGGSLPHVVTAAELLTNSDYGAFAIFGVTADNQGDVGGLVPITSTSGAISCVPATAQFDSIGIYSSTIIDGGSVSVDVSANPAEVAAAGYNNIYGGAFIIHAASTGIGGVTIDNTVCSAGSIIIKAGDAQLFGVSSGTVAGAGSVTIQSGDVSGIGSLNAGDITLQTAPNGGTLAYGGNIALISTNPGTSGTGVSGGGWIDMQVAQGIRMLGLPTADPHIPGALWTNAGVMTVSAG